MAKQPESKLQKKIQNAIQKKFPRSWFFKVHGGPFTKLGVPDLVGHVNGRFIALEVKTAKGKPSAIQLEIIDRINHTGGMATVVRSPEDAIAFIKLGNHEVSDTGCWEWKGARLKSGYGRSRVNGKMRQTSHLSYELFNGQIPEGMFVCHRCDNPGCIRPDHLFLGTPKDNMDDKVRKGRQIAGEKHKSAKLTEKLVKEIRARHETGQFTYEQLAHQYLVSRRQVYNIVMGRSWNADRREPAGAAPILGLAVRDKKKSRTDIL